MKETIIGIMAAMPEEIEGVVNKIENPIVSTIGGRVYTAGKISNKKIVAVFSRWGKVAAASTVTTLIEKFEVDRIIFTGIAGAIHEDLKVGDVVVASNCVFHDMDTRPLHDQYVVPLLNKKYFELSYSNDDVEKLQAQFSNNRLKEVLEEQWINYFLLNNVKVVVRTIASGDQFINSDEVRTNLKSNLPEVACVEMEGAAVAQVCYEHAIPCMVVRTISDTANHSAVNDFEPFAKHVASNYSVAIIASILSD